MTTEHARNHRTSFGQPRRDMIMAQIRAGLGGRRTRISPTPPGSRQPLNETRHAQ